MTKEDAKKDLIDEIVKAFKAGLLRYKIFPYAAQLDFDDKIDTKTMKNLKDYINCKYKPCVNKIIISGGSPSMIIYM